MDAQRRNGNLHRDPGEKIDIKFEALIISPPVPILGQRYGHGGIRSIQWGDRGVRCNHTSSDSVGTFQMDVTLTVKTKAVS